MDLNQANGHFTHACNLFQRGEHDAVLRVCQKILAGFPDHAQSKHLLGLVHINRQEMETAITFFRHAMELEPHSPRFVHDYALALLEAGKVDDAIPLLKNLTALYPQHAQAHFLLGNAYLIINRHEAAVGRFEAALRAKPDFPEALFNLGVAQRKLGRYPEAEKIFRQLIATRDGETGENYFHLGLTLQAQKLHRNAIPLYERALELAPTHGDACYNLGIALREEGRAQEAVAALKKARTLQPASLDEAVIACNIGLALQEAGQLEEALAAFEQAAQLNPNYAEAFSDWASALVAMDQPEAALEKYRHALAIAPRFHQAWYNNGIACLELLEIDQAIARYRQAISIKPDLVEAHWNLAITLLLAGRLQEGFQEYLWRWRRKKAQPFPINRPEWQGQKDPKLTLLVHTEQGLGDAIQFVRYLALVKKRVGRVFLACQPALRELFQSLPWVDAIFTKDKPEAIAPLIDAHVPLLNLPTIFQTSAENIPTSIPYLAAEKEKTRAMGHLFDKTPLPKIGIVWRGNPQHATDKKRSCSPNDFGPVLSLPGFTFYSLQKEHNDNLPQQVIDLAPHLDSFAHTAAILQHLDLLISVDTSVAHLAGAMGKPVWVLLPYVPDWRWMLEREDTPWYPTMRLFRQRQRNNWQDVLENVARALVTAVQERDLLKNQGDATVGQTDMESSQAR